jgi:hypothetical protein
LVIGIQSQAQAAVPDSPAPDRSAVSPARPSDSGDAAAQRDAQQQLQARLEAEHPSAAADAAEASVQGAGDATGRREAKAATAPITGADFSAGYIISDSRFYLGTALTAAGVQSFLNEQGAGCTAGALCLKNYTQTTYTQAADQMCGQYVGAANETAATILYRVGQLCGISQKVLLTLVQKESSLVTAVSPTAGDYETATGYGCADSAPQCEQYYYGFYNQVYNAAWQFKNYLNPPGRTPDWGYFPVGTATPIPYNVDKTCGAPDVTIQNDATAALYYYTPFQPDAAALANLYGTGDDCSSYGNRNFWTVYYNWFGNPTAGPDQFFTDVASSSPFYSDVQWMARLGLSTGTATGEGTATFNPLSPVSRQAMAAFLFRYNGLPYTPPATPTFADVDSSSPFYAAVEWMASEGISTGTPQPSGKPLFQPLSPVSRQAMAAFLARFKGGSDLPSPATPSFTDVDRSNPFYPQIEWMKSEGISTGNADGTYAPLSAVSRQAMAAFLDRVYLKGL